MMVVSTAELTEAAKLRPRGYLAECRALAVNDAGGLLYFEDKDYETLRAKYRDYTPTLSQKLAALTRSVSRWISAGMPLSELSLIRRRKAICERCEFWAGTTCQRCGCTGLKWGLQTERCPVGKW
jgi:hypothetical protein